MSTERMVLNSRAFAAAFAVSAACLAAPAALAQASGTAEGLAATTVPAPTTKSAPEIQSEGVRNAKALLEQGRLIEARAKLDALSRTNEISTLSSDDRAAALELLRQIDRETRSADPIEISLQRAEYFVSIGDLRQAERHANAVATRTNLTAPQEKRVNSVISDLSNRRSEITPMIPGLVEQAESDFNAGRFPAAKAGVLTVLRSGVELSPEMLQKLEGYQLKIIDIENSQGRSFDVARDGASMGMMQPGTVRQGDPEPAPAAAPASEPAPASTDSSVTITDASGQAQAAPNDVPASSPSPEPLPASSPAPAPVVSSGDGDIIQAAMRAEAQRTLAEADAAYNAARYREAAEKYGLCTTGYRGYLSSDEVARAERQLADARTRLDNQSSQGISQSVSENESIIRQQVTAEFNNLISQANASLEAGDVTKARDAAARARIVATGGRSHFTEGENENFVRQADELLIKIDDRARALETSTRESQDKEREAQARAAELNRVSERERKINESIDRIRALQAERKYRDALKVVDDVLFMDPNNPTALLLKDILRDIVIYNEYNEIQNEKAYRHATMTIQAEQATVPPLGIMDYPDNWPGKTILRGEQSAFIDSAANRQILSKLATTPMPVDFNGNRLADVIEFVRSVLNIPIDVEWDSLSQVGVDPDTQITLKLSPMPMNILLDRIMNKASQDPFQRAAWGVDQGILTIASDQSLRQNRSLVIYNIQDLLFDIPNYIEVPQIDLQSVLGQGQGGAGQSPFTGAGGQGPGAGVDPRPTREERVQQIIDIIQANIDPSGWKDTGGETGALQELNGSLIITNTPGNHREIVGLLSKLREIRNMQINVETKFLLVNQNWFEQIGFDLDIVINANNNQVRAARVDQPTTQPGDFFDFAGSRGTARGLQRSTVPADLNGDGDSDDAGEAGVGIVNPRGWSPVGVGQNSLGLTNSLAVGDFANGIISQAPALGIAGQFLDDIQVDFLITATQADQRTVQLTAPRLTFTNGQTSNIFVVTQQAFVSDLEPVVGDSAVGFDPEVGVVSEGVTLLVEGVISADRRYVTMNVDAGVARIDGFAQERVTAVAGGQLVNSADTGSFIQLPTVTVTRVRTTVTVPDEGTILLGGQRLITEMEVETGVPVLSKIPILNRFFTNRIESKEEQTLLILMKPTILIQSEQEEKAYPGLSDSVKSGLNFLR